MVDCNHVEMQNWFCNNLFPEMMKCDREIQNRLNLTTSKQVVHNKSNFKKKLKKIKNKTSDLAGSLGSEEIFEEKKCPEYLKFCQKSKKHQEKLTLIRLKREESEQEYIQDTVGPAGNLKPSVGAPKEPPGQQRKQELQQIYGKRANVIHSLETKLQSQFDQNLDIYRPHYWPIISLKL